MELDAESLCTENQETTVDFVTANVVRDTRPGSRKVSGEKRDNKKKPTRKGKKR